MANCATIPNIPFMPAQPRLAHAYVPFQVNYYTFELDEGFRKGTIFPELYSPYNIQVPPNERLCCREYK
ncbi:MAG: spore coat associated protein CotJA [Clostridiales bacterium]|nr:spore coat associated protein CotJA [Clostridiales bacterium]